MTCFLLTALPSVGMAQEPFPGGPYEGKPEIEAGKKIQAVKDLDVIQATFILRN